MAFCSFCGYQLEEEAKFCPKCGKKVNTQHVSNGNNLSKFTCRVCGYIHEGEFAPDKCPICKAPKQRFTKYQEHIIVHEEPMIQNKAKEAGFSTAQKVTLGITAFIAFISLWGSIGDGMWLAVFVLLVVLAAIVGLLVGVLEKKLAWITALGGLFAVIISIGISAPDKEEDQQNQYHVEQKQESETDKQVREQKEEEARQAQQQKEEAERQNSEREQKVKKIADVAYKKGYDKRMSTKGFPDPKNYAFMAYIDRYGVSPEDAGEKDRWDIFLTNYLKGYEDAWSKIKERMHSEDL